MTRHPLISLDLSWLQGTTALQIRHVLGQYRCFVRRFPCWLALTMGFAADARVRELLKPNLLAEMGDGIRPPHLSLLDRCLDSCDVDSRLRGKPLHSTTECENWFFSLFASGDTYASLCALGPATERISWQFLGPLEKALTARFDLTSKDLEYFVVHHPDVEDAHAASLEEAIRHTEHASNEKPSVLAARRQSLTASAIHQHCAFWTGCQRAAVGAYQR